MVVPWNSRRCVRSAVSTTWCTPKKLRAVSMAVTPACHEPVTANASTTSPQNRAGLPAWNNMKPASTTNAT